MKKLETLKIYQRDKNYHNNTSSRWQWTPFWISILATFLYNWYCIDPFVQEPSLCSVWYPSSAVHSISENLLKLPASSSPYAKWPVTNGKITKPAHTKDILPYCSLDSTIPHRKSLKQRQHGGEEGQDSSISFLPATHTAHASITARQLQIQAEPWIQSVTGL